MSHSQDKVERLRRLAASCLKVPEEEITPDTGVGRHPKWDSMAHVSVILAIEQEFGVQADEALMNCRSITELAEQLP